MSAAFFMNKSVPAGVLTAPGMLTKELAKQYSDEWQKNYGHGNQGKTAILGNGLVYSTITQNAQESQLTEQLKASAEMVCSTLHVPPYKVGIGAMPVYQNALVLNQIYYDDCLQTLMEAVENLLDDGLGLPDVPGHVYGTELDKDALLRMDEASLTKVLTEQAGGGITSPNEARARLNLGPVKGGESPKMQQQNFSLSALDKRDNLPDPFVIDKPTSNPTPSAEGPAAIADPNAAKMLEDFSANLLEHVGAIHKQVETRLIELDKRTEPQPDAELEGAKLFADLLIRQFETESVCG
jgi:phage portal protein BeeE